MFKVWLMIFAALMLVWLISYNTAQETEYYDFKINSYSV